METNLALYLSWTILPTFWQKPARTNYIDAAIQRLLHQGSALLVHPFSPEWYVGGNVLVQGRSSSIVEIGRFQLQRFTVSIKELAEWCELEVARLVVDECLAPRRN